MNLMYVAGGRDRGGWTYWWIACMYRITFLLCRSSKCCTKSYIELSCVAGRSPKRSGHCTRQSDPLCWTSKIVINNEKASISKYSIQIKLLSPSFLDRVTYSAIVHKHFRSSDRSSHFLTKISLKKRIFHKAGGTTKVKKVDHGLQAPRYSTCEKQ